MQLHKNKIHNETKREQNKNGNKPEVHILLPEGERDAGREVGQALIFKAVADLSDLRDHAQHTLGVIDVAHEEGHLGIHQRGTLGHLV